MGENSVQWFWMVYSPSGHAPTCRHQDQSSAVDEAKRLAANNPGREFFVLQAIGLACQPKPEVPYVALIDPDEIPF